MKDVRGGDCDRQVGLLGTAGAGTWHPEERAPVAPRWLENVVACPQRGQPHRLRAVQLRGEEKQPEEGLTGEEPEGHPG